jgi:hypothetical protein
MIAQSKPPLKVHPVERFLAWLVAAVCLAVTAWLWWAVSSWQSVWPLPALYFIEAILLYLVSAWFFTRPSVAGMRFVWAAIGALGIFSLLGALSVGIYFMPFPLILFGISLSFAIRNHRNLLVQFGMLLIGAVIQFVVMLGAVGLSQLFAQHGFVGNGGTGIALAEVATQSETPASLEYSNTSLGFSIMYPSNLQLTETPDGSGAALEFPLDPGTNVSSETISMDFSRPLPCTSSLAEGRDPSTLDEREVVLDGTSFLRQTFTGAALGSTHTLVSYAGTVGDHCLVFTFELVTYDPATLDPTAFPNPPHAVDPQAQVALFDEIMTTFILVQ